MLSEINPTASGAKLSPQISESITETWCSLKTPEERQAATAGGDVAGFVFVEHNAAFATASCFTTVPTIQKAVEYYGCQWGNDISQAEVGYFVKKDIYGSLLVPMLESAAKALKFLFDPHDLSVDYSTTRNTTKTFKWPNGKTLEDFFPDIETGDKVVLTSMPAVMPYGFGAVPVEGSIVESADNFAAMDNSNGEGLNLKAIHDAILLLKENGGSSYHSSTDEGEEGGATLSQINDNFLANIGGKTALRADISCVIDRCDRRSRDGMRIKEEVTKLQNLFAEKWILENPTEAAAYIRAEAPAPAPLTSVGKTATRKARFTPSDEEDEREEETRSRKRISVPKAMGKMGLELLLSTSKDGILSAGEVNDLLDGGFRSKEDLTTQMYEGHRETKVEVLMEFDTSAYRNLKMPPMTKMFLTALLNGNWSLNDPTLDKKGYLSLAAYFPLDESQRLCIEENIETAQADIDVGQATHNRTKILTTIHKSWAFKNLWGLATALRAFNAELLIASKNCVIKKDVDMASGSKPLICLYNEAVISTMESNKGLLWYKSFKQDHDHLPVSLAHKIGSCIARICSGAFDYRTNVAAQEGTMPAADSEFVAGFEDYEEFIQVFQKMINGGSIGQFGNATTLHKIAFPPSPRGERGERGGERGSGGSGRGGGGGRGGGHERNDHHQPGGRGGGGRGGGRGGGGGRGNGGGPPQMLNNPSGLTAPKVFANANPGSQLNFREIRLPQVRCNGGQGFLCGAAHIEGMNCTRDPCIFLHLPAEGLAALDQVGRDRVNLCVRSTRAIRFARGHEPATGGAAANGGTPPPAQSGGAAGAPTGNGNRSGTST